MTNESRSSARQGARKKCPWQQRCISKDRIRNILTRDLRNYCKDHGVNQHQRKWLKNRPCQSQHRLLVAHFNAMNAKRVKKISILPKSSQLTQQVERREGRRTDDLDRACFAIAR